MDSLGFVLLVSWLISLRSSIFVGATKDNGTEEAAVTIMRRFQDTYELLHGERLACNVDPNVTYLVQENQCISNQYLFNGEYEFYYNNIICITEYNSSVQNVHSH